jgi:hypothetical protein
MFYMPLNFMSVKHGHCKKKLIEFFDFFYHLFLILENHLLIAETCLHYPERIFSSPS